MSHIPRTRPPPPPHVAETASNVADKSRTAASAARKQHQGPDAARQSLQLPRLAIKPTGSLGNGSSSGTKPQETTSQSNATAGSPVAASRAPVKLDPVAVLTRPTSELLPASTLLQARAVRSDIPLPPRPPQRSRLGVAGIDQVDWSGREFDMGSRHVVSGFSHRVEIDEHKSLLGSSGVLQECAAFLAAHFRAKVADFRYDPRQTTLPQQIRARVADVRPEERARWMRILAGPGKHPVDVTGSIPSCEPVAGHGSRSASRADSSPLLTLLAQHRPSCSRATWYVKATMLARDGATRKVTPAGSTTDLPGQGPRSRLLVGADSSSVETQRRRTESWTRELIDHLRHHLASMRVRVLRGDSASQHAATPMSARSGSVKRPAPDSAGSVTPRELKRRRLEPTPFNASPSKPSGASASSAVASLPPPPPPPLRQRCNSDASIGEEERATMHPTAAASSGRLVVNTRAVRGWMYVLSLCRWQYLEGLLQPAVVLHGLTAMLHEVLGAVRCPGSPASDGFYTAELAVSMASKLLAYIPDVCLSAARAVQVVRMALAFLDRMLPHIPAPAEAAVAGTSLCRLCQAVAEMLRFIILSSPDVLVPPDSLDYLAGEDSPRLQAWKSSTLAFVCYHPDPTVRNRCWQAVWQIRVRSLTANSLCRGDPVFSTSDVAFTLSMYTQFATYEQLYITLFQKQAVMGNRDAQREGSSDPLAAFWSAHRLTFGANAFTAWHPSVLFTTEWRLAAQMLCTSTVQTLCSFAVKRASWDARTVAVAFQPARPKCDMTINEYCLSHSARISLAGRLLLHHHRSWMEQHGPSSKLQWPLARRQVPDPSRVPLPPLQSTLLQFLCSYQLTPEHQMEELVALVDLFGGLVRTGVFCERGYTKFLALHPELTNSVHRYMMHHLASRADTPALLDCISSGSCEVHGSLRDRKAAVPGVKQKTTLLVSRTLRQAGALTKSLLVEALPTGHSIASVQTQITTLLHSLTRRELFVLASWLVRIMLELPARWWQQQPARVAAGFHVVWACDQWEPRAALVNESLRFITDQQSLTVWLPAALDTMAVSCAGGWGKGLLARMGNTPNAPGSVKRRVLEGMVYHLSLCFGKCSVTRSLADSVKNGVRLLDAPAADIAPMLARYKTYTPAADLDKATVLAAVFTRELDLCTRPLLRLTSDLRAVCRVEDTEVKFLDAARAAMTADVPATVASTWGKMLSAGVCSADVAERFLTLIVHDASGVADRLIAALDGGRIEKLVALNEEMAQFNGPAWLSLATPMIQKIRIAEGPLLIAETVDGFDSLVQGCVMNLYPAMCGSRRASVGAGSDEPEAGSPVSLARHGVRLGHFLIQLCSALQARLHKGCTFGQAHDDPVDAPNTPSWVTAGHVKPVADEPIARDTRVDGYGDEYGMSLENLAFDSMLLYVFCAATAERIPECERLLSPLISAVDTMYARAPSVWILAKVVHMLDRCRPINALRLRNPYPDTDYPIYDTPPWRCYREAFADLVRMHAPPQTFARAANRLLSVLSLADPLGRAGMKFHDVPARGWSSGATAQPRLIAGSSAPVDPWTVLSRSNPSVQQAQLLRAASRRHLSPSFSGVQFETPM